MSVSTLTLAVILSATSGLPDDVSTRDNASPFAMALSVESSPLIIRGQTPALEAPPGNGNNYMPAPYSPGGTPYTPGTTQEAPVISPYVDPGTSGLGTDGFGTISPYGSPAYPAPITSDPWLGDAAVPYAAPAPGMPNGLYSFGLNGPQPYRYGWSSRWDFGFLPSEGTSSPSVGSLGIFEMDVEKEWVAPMAWNWIFSVAPQFSLRTWDGPRGTAGPPPISLPGAGYRFGLGLKMATPQYMGWSAEFGFNPAIASDLGGTLTSDGWLFDGHAVAFWRWNPYWMWALGAAYWDRVDGMVIPYAGVVYTPNQYWEFRLLFPKPRVSVFLGAPWGMPTWAYVSGEYHVEAYEVVVRPPGGGGSQQTRVEFEDWRVLGGLRWEAGWLTTFVEAGWVFGREVDYERVGQDFDVDTGFIARMGFRY